VVNTIVEERRREKEEGEVEAKWVCY